MHRIGQACVLRTRERNAMKPARSQHFRYPVRAIRCGSQTAWVQTAVPVYPWYSWERYGHALCIGAILGLALGIVCELAAGFAWPV